ncbi:unnamed protein product [Vitrella brassicaformis CCMP3155]|uniref:Thioredoxin domain-containing protein n=2 Tax=Vitrella brassicaformis TaxID=1169539 RepID=A0A0G4G8K7_VITBC|nr:unnamed protein product [Vitrella brassicaformis CCMP3155]|eukprot:CEM25166.1 unnamed protein product [Vitrella brassicaformis CCMP3155]
MRQVLFLALCGVLWRRSSGQAKEFIDTMEHDIQPVTGQTFDGAIRKFRDRKVSAVLFYTKNNECKKFIDGPYNELAKELKGMIKIAAVDCDDWPVLCKDSNVDKHPTVVVYPPNPIPAYPYTGSLTKKDLAGHLTRHIPSNVVVIEPAKMDEFLTTHIAVPKVLLFSNKQKPPVLFNALSNEFKDKLDFGFISQEHTELVKKFKVTTFPKLLVKRVDKKDEHYKGDMKFTPMFEWLNVFSETFVKGGGFADHGPAGEAGAAGGADAKPWLVQSIPELTKASQHDVCFKQKGLCVIYLKRGDTLAADEEKMLEDLKAKFVSHLADRGVTFYWMWMNMDVEKEFHTLFEVEKYPSVVVFNNKKDRKRFTKMGDDKDATSDNIKDLLDKILGGDARFKNVPDMPKWADRAQKKEKDEL